jgi:putative membrane protein
VIMLYRLFTKFLLVAFALILIASLLPGFEVENFTTALIVALVLGLFNLTVRPILFLLTLPLTILTFGLFSFVLNGLLLWFVASFVEGFQVDGFVTALIGALVISVFGWVGDKLLKD